MIILDNLRVIPNKVIEAIGVKITSYSKNEDNAHFY